MKFCVVTYNIHKGIGGVDRKYRPERIVRALRPYDPDILLMQEVDDDVPRSQRHRQVDWFSEALDLPHRAFQANVRLRAGHYGNAILSRYPLAEVQNLDLSVRLKKRRQALFARCELPGSGAHPLWLVNVHLGLAGFERTIQLRRLLQHRVFRAHVGRSRIIAGGDFNDVWGSLGRRLLEPVGLEPANRRGATFPAIRPVRRLDFIYYRGLVSCQHCFPGRNASARTASDHLPLVAEFKLR